MAGSTDLIGAFRAYAQKALGSDFNPEKAAATLNNWVKESGDALKERIERETERAVKKLGLAKESDLKKVMDELAQLRRELGIKSNKSSRSKKSNVSTTKAAKNSTKKKVVKKSANSRAGQKPKGKRAR